MLTFYADKLFAMAILEIQVYMILRFYSNRKKLDAHEIFMFYSRENNSILFCDPWLKLFDWSRSTSGPHEWSVLCLCVNLFHQLRTQ